jgi:predicted O-methyltransferase YrrM
MFLLKWIGFSIFLLKVIVMHPLLESILSSGDFVNSDGENIKIHSHTSKGQCEFLQKLISDNHFQKSIEIGFAYGISALAIADAVVKNGGTHTVIDIFQKRDWNGKGLELIKAAGLGDRLEFREQWCYKALPALLAEGRSFDFAYIDSTKQFDWILMNFFFLDKLLVNNGIIVFDDAHFPGIRKVVRMISKFPSYEVIAQYPHNEKPSLLRTVISRVGGLPGMKKMLRPEILKLDYKSGLNAGCVAVRKIHEDKRSWNWHEDF